MGLSIYVQHGELGDNAAGGGPVDSDRYLLLNSPIDGVALAELNAAEYPPADPERRNLQDCVVYCTTCKAL